jgi:hypothetical protein
MSQRGIITPEILSSKVAAFGIAARIQQWLLAKLIVGCWLQSVALMAKTQIGCPRGRQLGPDDGHVLGCHFARNAYGGFDGDIADGEAMKVQVRSANDAAEFVRERTLETMRRNIASMQQCGSSEEAIQMMVADTMDKIAEACVDVADTFAALTESFNDVPKVH